MNDAVGDDVPAGPVQGDMQLAPQEQDDLLMAGSMRDTGRVRLDIQAPGTQRRRAASGADEDDENRLPCAWKSSASVDE